jgi:hypothetical protein
MLAAAERHLFLGHLLNSAPAVKLPTWRSFLMYPQRVIFCG